MDWPHSLVRGAPLPHLHLLSLPPGHLHLPGAKPPPEHQRQKKRAREAQSLGPWASSGAAGPGVSSKALRSNGRV
uniref:Interleukin 17B n=1 Tax=Mus musculus TaxID=10090 RepID=A0A494B960_MOUSE